ncbi:MAG: ATP-binding protein [Alphaproteobacteria bacterium]|jgi:two-component system nitrogen regulation sensor histidine kinase GlnL|nr:ATP-binding protein [Alphaproteobacteria bacterium]
MPLDGAREDAKVLAARSAILAALPVAVVAVDRDYKVTAANPAAENMLGGSEEFLTRHRMTDLVAENSQLLSLIEQVFERGYSVAEYGVKLASPRFGEHPVDVKVTPLGKSPDMVVICLEKRAMAQQLDRQLTYRGAVRSVTGISALLAHEVKNPLSGIRGAAQLLEQSVDESEHDLTQLICSEADRIRDLVERMDIFADDRPLDRDQINIHTVLEHVRRLCESSADGDMRFIERYDPSLPPVYGNRDQLVQVFLNIVKNAMEAVPAKGGEIQITSSYHHGLRFSNLGDGRRHDLPIVVSVQDNGPGVPEDLRNHLFEPFVTTKKTGTGLGLSLVAKIVEDHGGLVECESGRRRTTFTVRLPTTR